MHGFGGEVSTVAPGKGSLSEWGVFTAVELALFVQVPSAEISICF